MRQESGRSMIEMMGVLAIMAMITVGAYKLIKMGFDTQKLGDVTNDMILIVTDLQKDACSGYDNFSDCPLKPSVEKNPYGGKYEVTADSANGNRFTVSITGLSKSVCEKLKAKAWDGSIGYETSNHKESGATANCTDGNNNVVSITYGEN